jgi:hypothetical protein
LFVSFFLAICVHSFIEEVDSGVYPGQWALGPRLAEGDLFSERWRLHFFLTPIFSEFVGGDFFLGRSALRCRVPSSSATDEIVSKQNTDPGRRVILRWKVTAIELA